MASSEVSKLQQHLALLKEEYGKLQSHCAEVERKYTLAAASAGDLSEASFVARLLMTVATLYGRNTYSDIQIKLQSKTMPAHKFVLNARSDDWNEEALKNLEELDWTNLPDEVGAALLKWLYTDVVDLSRGETYALQLMKCAASFKLHGLINKCEQALIATVGVRTCVKFYSAADEIGATALKEHCSGLISAHWDDLTGEDFAHMSSALLYRMLKSKTAQPLHGAVRLLREDVVFLCLVENNANLASKMFLIAKILFIIVLTPVIFAISDIYYDDSNDLKEAEYAENYLERKDRRNALSSLKKDYYSFDYYQVKGQSTTDDLQQPYTNLKFTTENENNWTSFVKSDLKKGQKKRLGLVIHEEYEYHYDESIKLSGNDKETETLTSHTLPTTSTTETPKNKTGMPPYLRNFDNLVPVVPNFNLKESYRLGVVRTWYTPEDQPCWELPLLYGELGESTPHSTVFIARKSLLKNVVIDDHFSAPKDKQNKSENKETVTSKWCGSTPCHADHVLCMYPEEEYGDTCSDTYEVRTPDNLQQAEIVYTLNSMRNRVATGQSKLYSHLPKAANIKQITYDPDLEKMAQVWLRRCLPGPADCVSLNGYMVTGLECTKHLKRCCLDNSSSEHCIPPRQCFIPAITGCLHMWYGAAGKLLTAKDVTCGHIERDTSPTVQMLWAKTSDIGCAFSVQNKAMRIFCNFSPGAPFLVSKNYFCGIIRHKDISEKLHLPSDLVDNEYLDSIGINLTEINRKLKKEPDDYNDTTENTLYQEQAHLPKSEHKMGVESLFCMYREGWARKQMFDSDKSLRNGTLGFVAKLVTQYNFTEALESLCDSTESIYEPGEPGSGCAVTGSRFYALCYGFRDYSPGYRLVAVLAPVALFTLILYDLMSGVVRQSNT